MTTMLEKAVTKALDAIWEADEIGDEEMRTAIRAALLAIREPDDRVVAAGTPHMPAETDLKVDRGRPSITVRPESECVSPAKPFTAMIDAILAEEPEKAA